MEKIKTKTLGDFKIIEHELGRGTMSRVLLGQMLRQPKSYIAVKQINIKQLDESRQKQIGNQIMNMLKLQSSPYIVQLYNYARTESHLYLFLEFCEDGDLKSYIEKRNGRLSEAQAIVFFRHIVEGFKKLFDNNIIHRDIKPANILLKQGFAKITDFGFSRVIDRVDESAYFTYLGSPLYTAPEILMFNKFGNKCDVWSVGIVLYQMLHGRTPWIGKNVQELRNMILTTQLQIKPQRSQQVRELLKGMLAIDPKNRIGWQDIFKHPICQQQITSVKLVQPSYTDAVGMFVNYLKQNVVRGYLMLNLQGVVASKYIAADMQVDQIAKYREKMLNIFVKIIHQRNIAFFYSYIIGILYRFPQRLPKKLTQTAELQFIIAKRGLEAIEHIGKKYLTQKVPQNFPPEDWQLFKATTQYQNLKSIIAQDYNILYELLKAIKHKIKQNYIDNKSAERIAKQLDMSGNQFLEVLFAVLEESMKTLNKQKSQDGPVLLLKELLVKFQNPTEFCSSEAFDFHTYYEGLQNKYKLGE